MTFFLITVKSNKSNIYKGWKVFLSFFSFFLGNAWAQLGINTWKQSTNRCLTPNWKVMKTVKFESFAQDKIQEKELNFLKGGTDPVSDVLNPPRR